MKLRVVQFKHFRDRVIYWVGVLGLSEWHVEVDSGCIDAAAHCEADLGQRMSRIVICDEWDELPSDGEINRYAFHEVVELLLMPLYILSCERFVSELHLEEARHGIIRRLENHLL